MPNTGRRNGGFSLVELLVVIVIIAIVISLILPALGNARNTARKSDTDSLVAQFAQAVGQFEQDQRRLPGVFSARQMGAATNTQQGFTAMDNAMLDLVGGVVDTGTGASFIQVGPGPSAAERVIVDLDRMASSGKKYINLPPKYFTLSASNPTQFGTRTSANADLQRFPVLVDAFKNPLMLWAEDESAAGKPVRAGNAGPRLASVDSSTPAKFYWASNAGWLRSTQYGVGQVNLAAGENKSLIGADAPAANAPEIESLIAILGNPSFPDDPSKPADQIYPTATRGKYVVHAAGADGVFLPETPGGSNKRRTTSLRAPNPPTRVLYGYTFKSPANTPHTDREGKPTTIDLIREFDDQVSSGS